MNARRFPPPWSVEELDACFVVKDSSGQKPSYTRFQRARVLPFGLRGHARASISEFTNRRGPAGGLHRKADSGGNNSERSKADNQRRLKEHDQ
jgi:hypothetical protein